VCPATEGFTVVERAERVEGIKDVDSANQAERTNQLEIANDAEWQWKCRHCTYVNTVNKFYAAKKICYMCCRTTDKAQLFPHQASPQQQASVRLPVEVPHSIVSSTGVGETTIPDQTELKPPITPITDGRQVSMVATKRTISEPRLHSCDVEFRSKFVDIQDQMRLSMNYA